MNYLQEACTCKMVADVISESKMFEVGGLMYLGITDLGWHGQQGPSSGCRMQATTKHLET